jgi:hypothetical protein
MVIISFPKSRVHLVRYPEEQAPQKALIYVAYLPGSQWAILHRRCADHPDALIIAFQFASRAEAEAWLDRASGAVVLMFDLLAEHDLEDEPPDGGRRVAELRVVN